VIQLTGKPIAITGASSGIGAATAFACAAAGMPVAIGARRLDRLTEIADKIRAGGGRVIVVQCDVSKPEDCQRLVDETIRAFGSIYAVYANAGYGVEAAVHAMSEEHVREMFETNFFGTLNTIRPALAAMLKNPGENGRNKGHVLICSSCLAKMTIPYYGVYSATKAAQNHIGRAMRLELQPLGVQVSTIHPIGTKTEFFDSVQNRSKVSQLIQHTPDRFMQTGDFVAACTVRCLKRPRPEVWTGFRGKFVLFGMSVTTLFPRLGDLTVKGMVNRRLSQKPVTPPS